MEKVTLQRLIDSKSERVTYEQYDGKSAAWKHFQLVLVDEQKVPLVKCNKCHTALKWKSKDGTSSLCGHHESCGAKSSASNTKITDMPGFSGGMLWKQAKIPQSVKSQMANELVTMCATDIRPFSVVEGCDFKTVAQKLIAVGAQYGNVPIADVLPSSSTVARHLETVVAAQKSQLREKLSAAANVGVTSDGWTHAITNQQYITTTAHYIDGEWNMHSHVLATRLANEKHTAHYISKFVRDILEEFGIRKEGNVFVTDNAANMKAAFRQDMWIGCAGHNLNLVLSHALQPSSTETDHQQLPNEVSTLITTCKELVTLSKRSSVNHNLETTLKQCVSTRWNSVLRMLQSVNDNRTQLRTTASDGPTNRKFLRVLSDLHDDVLEQVISILLPFDTATKVQHCTLFCLLGISYVNISPTFPLTVI